MKKILGIVGSLRESGNSEVMIKQICREIDTPHELNLLRLPEFKLKYCNGCYRCLMTDRGCVIRDDLGTILDAIAEADALILGVPTYLLAAHSCLKVFLDRGISFYSRAEQLWGKPAVGIGIAGVEGKEGSTLLDIERFFSSLLAQTRSCRVVYGALPGETVLKEENRVAARELARALFTEPEPSSGLTCTICGGKTFRFDSGNKLRCMLCSESGTLDIRDGQPVIAMTPSDHPFFSTQADALRHRDWLRSMVGRFKEQKEDLAKVRADYQDGLPWVRPPGQ